MGHVTIAPSCAMNGRIVCGKFSNSGRFDGHVTVHGRVELLSESMTTGEIVGRSIAAPRGASFRGKMSILPNTARLEGAISVSPSRVVRTR